MKIAVIAANGRTGKAFVSKALKKGHQIRAGVHRKNNLFLIRIYFRSILFLDIRQVLFQLGQTTFIIVQI